MSKYASFKCDGPGCGETKDVGIPDSWTTAQVTFTNLRGEPMKKELHYCDRCWPKFRKFMSGET